MTDTCPHEDYYEEHDHCNGCPSFDPDDGRVVWLRFDGCSHTSDEDFEYCRQAEEVTE